MDYRIALGAVVGLTAGCPSTTPADDDGQPVTTTGPGTTTGLGGSTTDEPETSTTSGAESSSDDGMGTTVADDDGTGSSGTAGEDSGTTGIPTVCGDNVIEGDEVCDLNQLGGETCLSLGYEGGILGCNLNCDDYNILGCYVCGNGVVDIPEDCEEVVPEGVTCESMGFEGGELLCGADCLWDMTDCSICGDGVRQGPESCDGMDLGGMDCAGLGLMGGTLACTASCGFDPTGCDIPGVPFGSDVGYSGYELQPGVLPCDDISGTGTPTGLTDDSAQSVPIGFTFPFYGVDFTDVTIQSNGTMRWGDANYLTFSNTCLPSGTNPSTNVLYVFWDDLNPSTGAGEVYYETLGMPGNQRLVVQWDVANFGGDAVDLMRFQVMLHEATGIIDVCYVDTINGGNSADSGAEATSGIQQDSMNALEFSCNTPDLVDGTQLLYIPL